MKKVNVILAAYNGEKFIREQIDSIIENFSNLESNAYEFKIIISDDSSCDRTSEIINQYSIADQRVILLDSEKKGGVRENFKHLIMNTDADYVFFSDQDDFWLPNKIELFLTRFSEIEKNFNGPIMVHSDLSVVNEELFPINNSMFEYQKINKKPTFPELLVSNSVTGCVMACNKHLIDIAKKSSIDESIMHDWYLALIASAFGIIDFIDCPLILYRQHSANQVGAKSFSIKALLGSEGIPNKIFDLRLSVLKTRKQAEIFHRDFSETMINVNKEYLETYIESFDLSFSYRLNAFLFKKVKKKGFLRNLFFFAFYVVKI